MENKFATWELVPWEIWQTLGENARNLVSGRLIHAANLIRHELNKPMTCNTYGVGGRDQCGLRTTKQPLYKATSRHAGNHKHALDGNKCLAADFIGDWKPEQVHAMILKNREKYGMITFIEIDITWLHIDVRESMPQGMLWSPTRGFVSTEKYIQELKDKGYWD